MCPRVCFEVCAVLWCSDTHAYVSCVGVLIRMRMFTRGNCALCLPSCLLTDCKYNALRSLLLYYCLSIRELRQLR